MNATTAMHPAAGLLDASAPARPLAKIVRLHFVDASRMLGVPLFIFTSCIVVGVVVMLLLRGFAPADPAELSEGFRYNQAALWCFAGYFMNIGVMAYARTMPYAVGMGATRRQYWNGTAVALLLESLYIGVTMVLLLLLEKATGHWFTGARMFDVHAMGNGSVRDTFLMGFGISAAMLFLGALFASVYLRWNQKGVLTLVFGTVVLLLLALTLVLASGWDVLALVGPFGFGKAALVLVLVAAVSAAGSWVVLRRAPIGR